MILEHNNKRLDLEFLRGFAVLIVFLFHYNKQIFPYYFVGVDLFFLISGYVITKSILLKKNFYFFEFILKRIKRIYPALIIILAIFFIYFILYTEYDGSAYQDTFFSTLTTFFGVSNYFYSINPNYFYFSQEIKFLHHTWSLSAEIQFYIFIGLFFYLFNIFSNQKFKFKYVIFFLIPIFISSLLLFLISNDKLLSGYYAFPGRIWEFLLGGIIYIHKPKKKFLNFHLLILIFSLFLLIMGTFNSQISYKIIIIFTIIYFSFVITFTNFYNSLIIDKILIFFGKLSFSFYLWHLIILTFYKNTFANIYFDFTLNLFLSTLFSLLTFIFIEEKFNKKSILDKYYIKTLKIFTFTSLILFAYLLTFNLNAIFDFRNLMFQKSIQTFNKVKKPILDINSIRGTGFVLRYDTCQNKSEDFSWSTGTNCIINNSKQTLFYIMGDSYGDHIVPTIATTKNKITLYKARLHNCHITQEKVCNANHLDIISSNFLNISKAFNNKFLILSVNHNKLSKLKIEKLLDVIDEDVHIIFMYRHPLRYEFNNPEIFKNYISIKNEDHKIIKNFNKNRKIYFFDNFNNLCIDCKIKEYNNFFDDKAGHFTLKTSLNLKENFEKFINNIN
jgi:peptidoglycan/LPS O-acetylase OafA/YrhL